MLRLRVDVLGDAGVDPPEVNDRTIQGHMRTLDLRVHLEELRETIFHHYLEVFLDRLRPRRLQGYLHRLLLVRLQNHGTLLNCNLVALLGRIRPIVDQTGCGGVLGGLTCRLLHAHHVIEA